MTELRKQSIKADDSFSIDAFGRWRVSEPYTIFDSKMVNDKQPLYYDEVTSGTGAATHDTNEASVTMSVSTTGDYVIRQSFMRFNYQPGKSQQIFLTGIVKEPVANTESRIGYFNTSTTAPYTANRDGIYFGQDGTNNYVAISFNGTENKITQANWNIDPMDGTGPSGKTADFDRVQIFFIDFEWLGVGRVRTGLVIDGKIFYIHEFNHANEPGQTTVYMQSPNHSVRYEAYSTGGSISMKQICASVASEGGVEASGVTRGITTGGAEVTVGTAIEGVLFYRLNQNTPCTTLVLDNFSAIDISNNAGNFEYYLILNPTIAGTTLTWNLETNSAIDVALGNGDNTLTGGTILLTGFATGDVPSVTIPSNLVINPGVSIDGTFDIVAIAVRMISGSDDFEAAANIREVTCG